MRLLALIIFFISTSISAQVITVSQQKALNNYVDYANQSAKEISAIAAGIIEYYPSINNAKNRKTVFNSNYTCRIQLEDFFFTKAISESKILITAQELNTKLKALRATAEKIDKSCKSLDTYYKLEDYKNDNYIKAEALVSEMPALLKEYQQRQHELMHGVENAYSKLNKFLESNSYHKTDLVMRQQLRQERTFIDMWTFNLNESLHTGWPIDKLQASISDTDKELKYFETFKPALKYPASSMIGSFKESLASILEIKRTGLDSYNFDAKKSDKHSNNVYLSLINYFNGTLVSDYNTFIEFSNGNNYLGLKAVMYIPIFEIRTDEKQTVIEIKPFHDIPRLPLVISPQKAAISKPSFIALNNYLDFINELLRQSVYLQLVLGNLGASASYYKDLTSYKGKGGLHFDYDNFIMPLSLYQKIIEESKSIPSPLSQPLNTQTEVLLNILKELDELSASLQMETGDKRYERDNLNNLYQMLARSKVLFEMLDVRKELLYHDVRSVYESYPVGNTTNSWFVSGKALLKLVDLDREGLFQAKAYYSSGAPTKITTEKIDEVLREVISNEYSNMKGVERMGRNNGLCPYTPYEDLPQSSKFLSENLSKLKPVTTQGGYQHPYHDMVYHYNDVVDDFNKFSELSKEIYILKTIRQPELFVIGNFSSKQTDRQQAIQIKATEPVILESPKKTEPKTVTPDKSKIIHDTVYIEKRDTVYSGISDGDLHSMQGYGINNMILLLDVSGSMNSPEKLPLLKKAVFDLLTMMRVEDEISIIIYSGKAKVLLAPTSFKNEEKIKDVVGKLKSEGKTDGNAGLKLAYKVADDNYLRGGNNRIILATDGEFSISDESFELVEKFSKQDIFISVFNFGKSNASSKNLERLCALGQGNYEHINKENVAFKLIREAKSKRKK